MALKLAQSLSERGYQVTVLTQPGLREGPATEIDFKSRRPDRIIVSLWKVFRSVRAADSVIVGGPPVLLIDLPGTKERAYWPMIISLNTKKSNPSKSIIKEVMASALC
jgi:hypothetical protein